MPRLVHASEKVTATVGHELAATATSAPAASPAKSPARKMSRAVALRRQWSQRDWTKKKSLPTTLPSFSYVKGSTFGVVIAGQTSSPAVAATASGSAAASGSTTVDSVTPGVAPLVKRRSRTSRATDVLSRLSSQFFHTPRRSSDSSSKTGVATTPATSEERRFWPRRLTSEKKLTLETPNRAAQSTQTVQAANATQFEVRIMQEQQQQQLDRIRRRSLGGETVPPSPTASLEPPFTPQHTLEAFSSELTELEKTEVLQHGEIYFFSSLSIKSCRRDGKIHASSSAVAPASHSDSMRVSVSASDAVLPIHGPSSSNENSSSAAASAATAAAPVPVPVELFNDGYDDERGDYLVLPQDHLAYRFEVLHTLGAGSFGQVVCCLDHQTQQQVAVKIIRNRKKYREQSLIEVQIVAQLQVACATTAITTPGKPRAAHQQQLPQEQDTSPRIVKMHEYFLFRSHLCIVFELLGLNLYEYLKLRFFQGLALDNVRTIAAQLVDALQLLKAQRVIHCDLKPENILIKPSSALTASQRLLHATPAHASARVREVCLIDFGSSCLENASVFTYIQSRFYRSPEVILGFPYSTAIDMWSLGCILVELHTGYPLFAGESEAEQLACIMELLGAPSHDMLVHARRRRHFFTESTAAGANAIGNSTAASASSSSDTPHSTGRGSTGRAGTSSSSATSAPSASSAAAHLFFHAKPFVNSRGRRRALGSRSFTHALKSDDWQFVEFVRKCLALDPRERMTPEQAACDPWLCASIVALDSDDAGDSARHRSISQSQEIVGI